MGEDPSSGDIERLMAVEEASIGDDGFTARVMKDVDRAPGLRRWTLYSAGVAGFGFAVGSVPGLVKAFPSIGQGLARFDSLMQGQDLSQLGASLSTSMALVVAVCLLVAVSSVTLALRER